MKKTEKKKLALRTETIRQLLPIELTQVVGGVNKSNGMTLGNPYTCGIGCNVVPTDGCPA